MCTKKNPRLVGPLFVFFLCLTLRKKVKNTTVTLGNLEKEAGGRGGGGISPLSPTFPFLLSVFLLSSVCRVSLVCRGPMSRGTPASRNQSRRHTTGEHNGVNDRQMKGRISDTCSLPLFLCLPPLSLSVSLYLSRNSLLSPSLLFFRAQPCHTIRMQMR